MIRRTNEFTIEEAKKKQCLFLFNKGMNVWCRADACMLWCKTGQILMEKGRLVDNNKSGMAMAIDVGCCGLVASNVGKIW